MIYENNCFCSFLNVKLNKYILFFYNNILKYISRPKEEMEENDEECSVKIIILN